VSSDERPIVLNTGCGALGTGQLPRMFSNWRQVRVDVDPSVAPDVLADIVDLAPIAAASVDAVWTAHCMEHLYEHDVARAMTEIRRVLKPDAFACIVVPDLQRIAAFIAEDRILETIYESPAGPITPHDVVYGFGAAIARGQVTMAHRCGFTPAALTRQIVKAGFGGYSLLRRAGFELAAVVRAEDWASPSERDELLAKLGL